MVLSEALFHYSKLHVNSQNNWYNWRKLNQAKFPKGISIDESLNLYWQNILLKKQLSSQYAQADKATKLILTKYYISTWGGIHGNNSETMKCYASRPPNELIKQGDKGIASWSKALVVRDPSQYAIYDARVAFSLNLLQVAFPVDKGCLYPLLASRNTHAGNWKQFILSQANGWNRVGDDFYTAYLNMLSEVSESIDCDISTLEMLLFSMVDDLFVRASSNR